MCIYILYMSIIDTYVHVCLYTHTYIVLIKFCWEPLTFEVFNVFLFPKYQWGSTSSLWQVRLPMIDSPTLDINLVQLNLLPSCHAEYFQESLPKTSSNLQIHEGWYDSMSQVHKELALEPKFFSQKANRWARHVLYLMLSLWDEEGSWA